MSITHSLILASSSAYRKELLSRLMLPFSCHSPNIDETPLPKESPQTLCQRLAKKKATVILEKNPNSIVIGSDQVAYLDNTILSKPLSKENAFEQLTFLAGKKITFLTALHVLSSKEQLHYLVPTTVSYRPFKKPQIEKYLEKENGLSCAGSSKIEGLGISLVERVEAEDPTAIIGLPLIKLTEALQFFGYQIP